MHNAQTDFSITFAAFVLYYFYFRWTYNEFLLLFDIFVSVVIFDYYKLFVKYLAVILIW